MAKQNTDDLEIRALLEPLDLDELKNTVIRLWKEIKSCEAQKKEYNTSIKKTIDDIKHRIDVAVEFIGHKETSVEKEKLVSNVNKALEGGKDG